MERAEHVFLAWLYASLVFMEGAGQIEDKYRECYKKLMGMIDVRRMKSGSFNETCAFIDGQSFLFPFTLNCAAKTLQNGPCLVRGKASRSRFAQTTTRVRTVFIRFDLMVRCIFKIKWAT